MRNEKNENGEKLLDKSNKNYADMTVLRSLISVIPYVGGSIDIILSHRGQVVAQERVEHLINSLTTKLEEIDEKMVDKLYLETEEWIDVVYRAMEKSTRIRNRNRIEAIASILKGTVTHEVDDIGHPEDLINVISELNDDEAIILGAAYSYMKGDISKNSILPHVPDYLSSRIDFLLKRIQSIGIISERTGSMLGYAGGSYIFTQTGKQLLDYLVKEGSFK